LAYQKQRGNKMEDFKTFPLAEFLKQHRKDCAKAAGSMNFWFSSIADDVLGDGEQADLE
jgi:hypothetical protein